jgi:TrpR family transcriptional regulator, trp operon repressor
MDSDNNLVHENIAEMSKALSKAGSPDLVEGFLFSLFTPSEADEIAKRWALVKDLAKGRPQREIAKDLGLSLCKITRGSRELKKENSSFKRMLEIAGYEVPRDFSARRGKSSATSSGGQSAAAGA